MPVRANTPSKRERLIGRTEILLVIASLLLGVASTYGLDHLQGEAFVAYFEPHSTWILSEYAGNIRSVIASPGQTVSPGDPIAELEDAGLQQRLENSRREFQVLAGEVERTKAEFEVEFSTRHRALKHEILNIEIQKTELMTRWNQNELTQHAWQERLKLLFPPAEDGVEPAISTVDSFYQPSESRLRILLEEERALSAIEETQARLQLCETRLTELKFEELALEEQLRRSSGFDLALTRLQQSKEALASLELKSSQIVVRSKAYGVVASLKVNQGDRLAAGDQIGEVIDDVDQGLLVIVPSSSAARFTPGHIVDVVFSDNNRRKGTVAAIPAEIIRGQEGDFPRLKIRIEPHGRAWPRMPRGSQATIFLSRFN